MWHCAPKLDLDPYKEEHRLEFDRLTRYLASKGYISNVLDRFTFFAITQEGRRLVEGDEQKPTHVTTTHNYNIGRDAYSPVMGEQENVNINVSFDMRSVK